MKLRTLPIFVIACALILTGCGGDSGHGSDHPDSYNKCLETEAAKLLDETGSNLDYANEKAAEICAK
jgi:predicted small secreted protein